MDCYFEIGVIKPSEGMSDIKYINKIKQISNIYMDP